MRPATPSAAAGRMSRTVLEAVLASVLIAFCACALPQPLPRSAHESARIISSDIDLFVAAQARIAAGGDAETVLQSAYLDRGSRGLADFARLRIGSTSFMLEAMREKPEQYAPISSIAAQTGTLQKRQHRIYARLAGLYPDAAFPDVYLLVGGLDAGGSVSEAGLLIGTEHFTQAPEMLPVIIAHELVHFQQPDGYPGSLLGYAIREGAADFIGEMISGDHINRSAHRYGLAHEAGLWHEFQAEMHGVELQPWLYGGPRVDAWSERPNDLGYFIGYRIVQSYYDRATDKSEAIRDILRRSDYDAFVRESGYAPAESR